MPQITLQLTSQVERRDAETALAAVVGVRRVQQVFPDDEDDELARVYVLDVAPADTTSTLAALLALNITEYCEMAPIRDISRR